MSRRIRITRTGAVVASGALTGYTVAKVTKSVAIGVVTATKAGAGLKAAPAFAVLGALAFLGASAVKMMCSGKRRKYSWQ